MEWTDDKIIQLITFYEQHACLYDVSDRTYHNRPPFFFFLTSSLLFKNSLTFLQLLQHRHRINPFCLLCSTGTSVRYVCHGHWYQRLVPVTSQCDICLRLA